MSVAVKPRAASFTGSTQMRMASGEPPLTTADATPGTEVMSGCATRVAKSTICEADMVSLPKATYCTAEAPSVIRSEEHTSELQSLMRISYAVFCLKTKRED